MLCSRCGVWELASGDLVCSWCGASYLRYTLDLDPAELSTEDYPPPIELRVRNESPTGSLALQRIQTDRPWISVLLDGLLPDSIAAGTTHSVWLEVDTFAAGTDRQATITVAAQYAAEPQTVELRLR